MAVRKLFGGWAADFAVVDGGGGAVEFGPDLEVLFYNARTGGTQYTDLSLDAGGGSPVDSTTTSDGTGGIPIGVPRPIYGPPDDTRSMWAQIDGGPRVLMMALETADDLTDLATAYQAHVSDHQAHNMVMGDLLDTNLGDPDLRTDGVVPRWNATTKEWDAASGSGATGALLLDAVGQVVTPPPGTEGDPPWFEMTMPYSGGDTNPDSIQLFNETAGGGGGRVKTFWLNGNNEMRGAPSTNNRIGARFFEAYQIQGYSNSRFFELSTNPTNPGVTPREALFAGYGQASGSKPGWAEATRVLSALQGIASGGTYPTGAPLNQAIWRGRKTTAGAPSSGTYATNDLVLAADGWYLCTAGGTPGTWVPLPLAGSFSAITPGTNMQDGTPSAQARLEQGGQVVRMRGVLNATGAPAGGATIGTLPAGMFPGRTIKCAVRKTGGNDVMTINTSGQISLGSALASGNDVFLDAITFAVAS